MFETEFEDMDNIIRSFSKERQAAIASRTEEMMLSIEASQLKGTDVREFGCHLRSLGAQLFVRMPNGKEVELLIPGVHTSTTVARAVLTKG